MAAEECLESKIRKLLGKNYITADLMSPRAMIRMDITDIQFPDGSFDIVFCNHVLEHVSDDRRAMKEFHRILKQDGCAMLLVPITANITFEDPTVTDPKERLRLFGQEDHVRRYGPDYINRLREAGFTVQAIHSKDLVTPDQATRFGFTEAAGMLFYCTKAGAVGN